VRDKFWTIGLLALAVALSLAAAGCGGGTTHYFKAVFADCVSGSTSYTVDTNPSNQDFVAQSAGEGGATVTMNGNQRATLYFERTATDADRTAHSLTLNALSGNVKDLMSRKGNVVIVFDKSPTSTEKSTIVNCLKPGKGIAASTQSTTSTASTSAASTPTSTSYPQAFVTAYINACTKSGGSQSQCLCLITKAQAKYSISDFLALSKAINDPTKPRYQEGQALVNACRGA
jgi:hypothetical protein